MISVCVAPASGRFSQASRNVLSAAVPFASFDVSNCLLKKRTYITECKRTNKDLSFLASSVLSLPAISESHERPYTAKSPRPNCHPIHKSVPLAMSARRERLHSYDAVSAHQARSCAGSLKIKWLVIKVGSI